MPTIISENFDGVTAPAMPSDIVTSISNGTIVTSTDFVLSGTNSLKFVPDGGPTIISAAYSKTADSSNGNCTVSASVYFNSSVPANAQSAGIVIGVGSQVYEGGAGSGYFFSILNVATLPFNLVRSLNGSLVGIANNSGTTVFPSGVWYTLTMTRNGSTLWCSCQRQDTLQWAVPTGGWQTSFVNVMIVTDGSPLANSASYGGVFGYIGSTAVTFYADNFSVYQQTNPRTSGPLRSIQIGGEYLVAAAQFIGNTWLQIVNSGLTGSSIKTQIDLAIGAGCNCVRLGSGTEGVSATFYTMAQYLAAIKIVLAYCRKNGLWVSFVEDESVIAGLSGQTAIWNAAIAYRVAIAPVLAQYANVLGFDIANEYDHIGGITPLGGSQFAMNSASWDAFFQQALPAIRAVAPNLPLTASTLNGAGLSGSTYQFDYIETHQYGSAPGVGSYSGIYSNAGASGKYFFIGEHGQFIGSSAPTRLQMLQGVWTNVVQGTYSGQPGCIGASWYVCLYDSLNSGCGNQSCGYEMWSEAAGGGPPYVLEADIGPTWEGYTVTPGIFPIPSTGRRRRPR